MSIAVFEDVALAFGKKTIVEGFNLRIGAEDRIGLIGPNGSGKTSLLRLLAQEQVPDYGSLRCSRGVRVGYLPQDLSLDGGRGLLGFVRDSVPGRAQLDEELAQAEEDLTVAEAEAKHKDESSANDALMAAAERLSDLHERIGHYDMHYTEHAATRILAGLGFQQTDHGRDLSEFSGGWKMRAVLASLLFQQPDLMLLDEPTNHLDLPTVAWFADFLKKYERSFILICHDREFLNEQIKRIVTFEVEGVRQYPGNYEKYLTQRAEEEVVLENKAKNLAREREHAERFITRFRAQANKAKAVQSRVKALAKMESVETYRKHGTMRFKFPACARAGVDTISVSSVSKHFGELVVLKDVNLSVRRGERIGIIGVNGAGKTTLLRMMASELETTTGEIKLGHNVKCGYYAQHHAETLDKTASVFDEVSWQAPTAGITQIRSVLGAFLFSDDDVDKKIAVLSGGERARVALARLLINPGNLLLMDEPTNHLDLASSEALAESLASYDGTLVFVSHNRSFVRKLATRIWNVADGTVETYPGTLDEYMEACRQRLEQADPALNSSAAPREAETGSAPQAAHTQTKKRGTRAEEKARKRREAQDRAARSGERKLEAQITGLEAEIAELEEQQEQKSTLLADPDVYSNASRSTELMNEYNDGKDRLSALTDRWEQAQLDLEAMTKGD